MQSNIRRVALFTVAAFIAISFALIYWQVIRAAELVNRPDNPRILERLMRERRGSIYDREGKVLANSEVDASGYIKRTYSELSLAQVVGFFNPIFGSLGLEKSLDKYLSGQYDQNQLKGLERRLLDQPSSGLDTVLSIDLELQKIAVEALAGADGAVVALNPKTGELLALVSNPYYDPNPLVYDLSNGTWATEGKRINGYWEDLRQQPDRPILNRATQGLYAPGSTFKTVTLAAALELGVVKLDAHYTFDMRPPDAEHRSTWHKNQFVSCQNHSQSQLNLVDAYTWSCNVVFSELGLKIGEKQFTDFARGFGLDDKPPWLVETAESRLNRTAGYFSGDERFYALASTAMGQGELTVTPLQMALITSAAANNGVIPKPQILAQVKAGDGKVILSSKPEAWKVAMSAATASQVKEIMVRSAEEGWARAAKVKGIAVAGKTGTAEAGEGEEPHSWFIGFAPADDPQIALAIIVEHGGYGSDVAAPIARAIFEKGLAKSPR